MEGSEAFSYADYFTPEKKKPSNYSLKRGLGGPLKRNECSGAKKFSPLPRTRDTVSIQLRYTTII